MKTFLVLILSISSLLATGQVDQWKDVYKEPAWRERDVWQNADAIIRKLNVKPGDKVADIGCHEGYMTIKLSGVVGVKGEVIAVDINQAKLDKLKGHLDSQRITNVIPVLGDADNPKLPAGGVDGVLILDTYHEMKEHDKILAQINTSLKPSGRLVLCEPIATERRKWSRAEQESKHELDIHFALEDLRKAGFEILFSQDPFVDREKIKGDKMWIIVGKKVNSE